MFSLIHYAHWWEEKKKSQYLLTSKMRLNLIQWHCAGNRTSFLFSGTRGYSLTCRLCSIYIPTMIHTSGTECMYVKMTCVRVHTKGWFASEEGATNFLFFFFTHQHSHALLEANSDSFRYNFALISHFHPLFLGSITFFQNHFCHFFCLHFSWFLSLILTSSYD